MENQPLEATMAGRPEIVTWTVEQYHRMLEAKILAEGEPVELLNGVLVRKDRGPNMTVNPLHALVVNRLMQLAPSLEVLGCHIRLQNPITIPPNHEPEPDGAIVYGVIDDYVQHHPGPKDTFCGIEVADSSLERDRTTKQTIYAAANIPYYIIANLAEQCVELYEEPVDKGRYRHISLFTSGDRMVLRLPDKKQLEIPASQCLP